MLSREEFQEGYVLACQTPLEDGLEGEQILAEGPEVSCGKLDDAIQSGNINLIKSKGAVFAAANVLVQSMGINFSEIGRIFVAGGFGNYLNIEKAIAIGLLPNIAPSKSGRGQNGFT